VIALVGPTGVGKTTTLAKLAARYADKFDLRDIALVTTDCFRIGAREQLFTYGQLLGVPVFTAQNREELEQVLAKLSQRKLVLIDTAGMGPRDTRLAAQFSVLEAARASLRTYLVLAANAQPADLQDVVKQFRATPLSGAILTKVDEAARLGGALSTVIRHKLPVAYITDGQKVPEDIHRERPDQLVLRAIRVVRERPDARELPIEEAINACA
jgi:flagellar biosynthesis protein FlhF